MKVNIFFRNGRPGANSIEELFNTVMMAFPKALRTRRVEVPFADASLGSLIQNLRFSRKNKASLNHITGDVHYLALALGRRTVLTIHDSYSVVKGNSLKKLMMKILWFWLPALIVKRITTISEKSRKEIEAIIPFARHKIRVVPNPYNPQLIAEDVPHKSLNTNALNFDEKTLSKPVILQIGTKENKNLERTIAALDGIPCKLVIIGKVDETQANLLSKHDIDFKAYFNLPYDEVAVLYHQCDLVCFASLYEGFGMPIIEAQLIGKPVVTSNIAPMPWVAGKGACLVDPYDVGSVRQGILEVLDNQEYRSELVRNGLENVKRFEPKKVAAMYEEVYMEVLGR